MVTWQPALAAGLGTIAATGMVLRYLRHRQIMDLPNERSSHTLPTPRGGGLAVTPVLAAVLLALDFTILGLGALVLLAVSWLDDRKGLPPLPRFLAHAAVIGGFLALLPGDAPVFGGVLPLWADRLLAGLGWLWFVNLYNFMDGIDGITGVESASLGLGIALVGGATLLAPGLAVAAIGLGFLAWNWHPAKLFLGDSGSVPLGYVLGGLLLLLAMDGQLAAALILPAYYLADATITITRRAANGEKVWQAHRKHFYQRAVQGGKRHDQVALAIAGANALLIAAAWAAAQGLVWQGAVAAIAIVAGLLARLQKWARP